MKETLQDLKSRRSVRSYLPKQISEDELCAVLEAGTWAPTGMGRQSPKIVVVQDQPTIALLTKLNAEIMGNPDADPFYGAPTIVIVFADKRVGTYLEDGSLVMGNLLNAAHAVGLGSCWIHRAKETFHLPQGQKLMEKWGLEDFYEGIGHCILGYSAGDAAPKPRKADYILRV